MLITLLITMFSPFNYMQSHCRVEKVNRCFIRLAYFTILDVLRLLFCPRTTRVFIQVFLVLASGCFLTNFPAVFSSFVTAVSRISLIYEFFNKCPGVNSALYTSHPRLLHVT
jgi:hypothetical protein